MKTSERMISRIMKKVLTLCVMASFGVGIAGCGGEGGNGTRQALNDAGDAIGDIPASEDDSAIDEQGDENMPDVTIMATEEASSGDTADAGTDQANAAEMTDELRSFDDRARAVQAALRDGTVRPNLDANDPNLLAYSGPATVTDGGGAKGLPEVKVSRKGVTVSDKDHAVTFGPKSTSASVNVGGARVTVGTKGSSAGGNVGNLPVSVSNRGASIGPVDLALKTGAKINPIGLADTVTGGVVSSVGGALVSLKALKAERDLLQGQLFNLEKELRAAGKSPYQIGQEGDDLWTTTKKRAFQTALSHYVQAGIDYNKIRDELARKFPEFLHTPGRLNVRGPFATQPSDFRR